MQEGLAHKNVTMIWNDSQYLLELEIEWRQPDRQSDVEVNQVDIAAMWRIDDQGNHLDVEEDEFAQVEKAFATERNARVDSEIYEACF